MPGLPHIAGHGFRLGRWVTDREPELVRVGGDPLALGQGAELLDELPASARVCADHIGGGAELVLAVTGRGALAPRLRLAQLADPELERALLLRVRAEARADAKRDSLRLCRRKHLDDRGGSLRAHDLVGEARCGPAVFDCLEIGWAVVRRESALLVHDAQHIWINRLSKCGARLARDRRRSRLRRSGGRRGLRDAGGSSRRSDSDLGRGLRAPACGEGDPSRSDPHEHPASTTDRGDIHAFEPTTGPSHGPALAVSGLTSGCNGIARIGDTSPGSGYDPSPRSHCGCKIALGGASVRWGSPRTRRHTG